MFRQLLGLFGGTFDPVHRGHLETARAAYTLGALDRLLLIPAATPPHRQAPQASAAQRLEMLALASRDDDRLHIDERELHRAGPSYTFDTLTELGAENPDTALVLVLGQDAANGLPQWHRAEALSSLCHLLVMRRPDPDETPFGPPPGDWQPVGQASDLATARAGLCLTVTGPQIPVSATAIREHLRTGQPVGDDVPAPVLALIREQGLYQD